MNDTYLNPFYLVISFYLLRILGKSAPSGGHEIIQLMGKNIIQIKSHSVAHSLINKTCLGPILAGDFNFWAKIIGLLPTNFTFENQAPEKLDFDLNSDFFLGDPPGGTLRGFMCK